MDFVRLLALSSKAEFLYDPKIEEIKVAVANIEVKPGDYYEHRTLTKEQEAEGRRYLIEKEAKKYIQDRNVAGDASETGIVKFVQGLMDINKTREQ